MSFVFKVAKDRSDFRESLCWLDALSSPTFFWSAEKLQETWLKNKTCELSWLELPVGHVCAFILWQQVDKELEIFSLATRPERQRQGVMSRLFQLWLPQVKKQGVRVIYLEVHNANLGAQSLYEGVGFLPCGWRRAYYRDGGDACIYRLEL